MGMENAPNPWFSKAASVFPRILRCRHLLCNLEIALCFDVQIISVSPHFDCFDTLQQVTSTRNCLSYNSVRMNKVRRLI